METKNLKSNADTAGSGKRLKSWMKRKNVSIDELSAESGVGEATIKRMRQGKPAGQETICSVSTALDLNIQYWLFGEGRPDSSSDESTEILDYYYSVPPEIRKSVLDILIASKKIGDRLKEF